MKVVIISDSHGNVSKFKDIIILEKPEVVIWTGDCSSDAEIESYIYSDIKFYIVRGNCDLYDTKFNDEEIIEIEGKKIFLTHGHLYEVKRNILKLEKEAEIKKVDVVCFGHTHQPYLELKNSIYYFNPGALKDGRYGTLEIKNKKIELKQKKI